MSLIYQPELSSPVVTLGARTFDFAREIAVVGIVNRRTMVPRRREPRQSGRHAVLRQVLRHAVVLVPSGVLPGLRDVEITDRPHPRSQLIHATKRYLVPGPVRPPLSRYVAYPPDPVVVAAGGVG